MQHEAFLEDTIYPQPHSRSQFEMAEDEADYFDDAQIPQKYNKPVCHMKSTVKQRGQYPPITSEQLN